MSTFIFNNGIGIYIYLCMNRKEAVERAVVIERKKRCEIFKEGENNLRHSLKDYV